MSLVSLTLGSRVLAQDFTGGRQAGRQAFHHRATPSAQLCLFIASQGSLASCCAVAVFVLYLCITMPRCLQWTAQRLTVSEVLAHGHSALAPLACVEAEHCGGECRQKQSLAARK